MFKKKILKITLYVILAAAVVFTVLMTDTICVFKRLSGFPCPGCGMTRALMSVLRLDFKTAFAMHPLWPVTPVFLGIIAAYTFDRKRTAVRTRIYEISIIAIAALMILVWIIRLCYGWRG